MLRLKLRGHARSLSLLTVSVASLAACSSGSPIDSESSGGSSAGGNGATDGGSTSEDGGGAGTASGGDETGGQGGSSRLDCKRGIAYGYHSIPDLKALSKGVSFWYNWDFRPDEALRSGAYREEDVEYIPMIWGKASDRNAAQTAIPEGARYLLGFNEPNFGSQANISAEEAAELWPAIEAVADARELKLVSPAVNFCGGSCQDTDPFRYLDEFLAACPGCRIDAIAMHIYVGCSPSGDNKAEWLINHVETYKQRFDKPLWLTEFACDSAKNFDEQQAFLEDAVTYLEAEPRIERYAWFAGRADNMAFVDLLGEDGTLTSLGEAYVSAAQPSECTR